MPFTVNLKESVIDDLRSLGRKEGRRLLEEYLCEERNSKNMKVIPLSEAKANLRRYGHLCHDEPIVVTVNGVPSFQLAPIDDDENLVDRLIEHDPKFRELIEKRLGEPTVTVKAALRRL